MLTNGSEPCRNCGYEPLPSPADIEKTAALIGVPESEKVDEQLFTQRIRQCSVCEYLNSAVLCSQCGCFVQIRARYKSRKCPHPAKDFWQQFDAY